MAPVSLDSTTSYPSPTAFYEPDPGPVAYTYSDVVPSSVPSVLYQSAGPAPPDTGLHQFTVYMVILAAVFLLCAGYIIGNYYIDKWRAENMGDDEEKASTGAAFRPPAIAIPPRSATFSRSDRLPHHQQRPLYVSQADMLSGNGRGFFG
ncbi:hypothetical protein B0H19DRAFT_1058789 [Mycena capillaripes]|nr:hypothetical protein B0H19DRAFT_1058789 [Mycena capillaripes]